MLELILKKWIAMHHTYINIYRIYIK